MTSCRLAYFIADVSFISVVSEGMVLGVTILRMLDYESNFKFGIIHAAVALVDVVRGN
jgi:hypothetical protein